MKFLIVLKFPRFFLNFPQNICFFVNSNLLIIYYEIVKTNFVWSQKIPKDELFLMVYKMNGISTALSKFMFNVRSRVSKMSS